MLAFRYRTYHKIEFVAAWEVQAPLSLKNYELQTQVVRKDLGREKMPPFPKFTTKLDGATSSLRLNGREFDQTLNEKWLLHGTKPELVFPILENGLNERLSGGMFGSGIYLAEDAEKIDQYTAPDAPNEADPGEDLEELRDILYGGGEDFVTRPHDGHNGDIFYAFVVAACCGMQVRTKDGRTDLDRPGKEIFATHDQRELVEVPGTKVRFHSLLAETGGRLARYREIVLFKGERVYIAYLVAYMRK